MARRRNTRAQPPKSAIRTTVSRRSRHTTVPSVHPPRAGARPRPTDLLKPPKRPSPPAPRVPTRKVAHIIGEDSTLLDIIDNLLSKGVMLNADVILALANVDLVYLRLSALLCAADRVLPQVRGAASRPEGTPPRSTSSPGGRR